MVFAPKVDQALTIDGVTYKFTEHPAARGMVYGQEGRFGTVYQVGGIPAAAARGESRLPADSRAQGLPGALPVAGPGRSGHAPG